MMISYSRFLFMLAAIWVLPGVAMADDGSSADLLAMMLNAGGLPVWGQALLGVVAAASAFTNLTDRPDGTGWYPRLYRLIELAAMLGGKAKQASPADRAIDAVELLRSGVDTSSAHQTMGVNTAVADAKYRASKIESADEAAVLVADAARTINNIVSKIK